MIIDIQEEVFDALKSISEDLNIYTMSPSVMVEDNIVIFYELDNIPAHFSDGRNFTNEIRYNVDIYTKEPITHVIRGEIEQQLNTLGFVRVSGGRERKLDQYYYRALSYKIIK